MQQLLSRLFISVLLGMYLSVSLASFHKETTWGRYTYDALKWMPRSLCLWQNWGMFAPPPGSSSWLRIEGTTRDGEDVDLEPLFTPLEEGFFRPTYDRLLKLSLSADSQSRRSLRVGIGRHICHREREAGLALKEVRLVRDRTWTIRPSKRLKPGPKKRREKTTTIETIKCQRQS